MTVAEPSTAPALPSALAAMAAAHPVRSLPTARGAPCWREAGRDGLPVLVLLHGIGSGSGSWLYQLAALGETHRVIAWDAPGYGASTPLAEAAPRAADYAAALARLVDALDLDRFTLVGHSLGALIATAYAARHPDRLDRLVLLNPARGYHNAPADLRRQKLDDRLALMERLGPAEHARQRGPALLGPGASDEARALVIWNGSQLNPAGYAQAARMLANGDIGDDAAGYDGPVLVACGSEDRITPEQGCRLIAAAFARAQYHTLPGLGHASYIDAPQLVNPLLASGAG
jgi:pimeloyl-ACP methyl ester carboxylesterase